MSAQPDPLFPDLAAVPDGVYPADASRPWWHFRKWWTPSGWLSVDREGCGRTSIMWTSDRHTHQPLVGPAVIITFAKSGAIVAFFETALTLHLVDSYAEDYIGPRNPRAIDAARRMQQWLCKEVPA